MSYGEVITDQLNIAHRISTNEINEPSNTNGMNKNRGIYPKKQILDRSSGERGRE
jgi:hypothetical protein